MRLGKKLGFEDKKTWYAFLSVVLSGQIIYSSFEAFKGSFLLMMTEVMGITNAEMGTLFSMIGISMFFFIPGGWVNNRFSARSIILVSLAVRFVTMMYVLIMTPEFIVLRNIAIIWGIKEAIFWPAVLNGVSLLASEKNKGVAFGLLESIRRATEMGMNLALAGLMTAIGGSVLLAQQEVFKKGMIAYTIIIIPMFIAVYKYVPANELAKSEDESQNKLALKGLLKVISNPAIWSASLASLTVYWCYINLMYTVPYLQAVFNITSSQAAFFGIINTAAMGVFAGIISGVISDKVFKSSTKMMCFSLGMTSVILFTILLMPKTISMLIPNMILLFMFSFSIFLAKGIILAPVAELKIEKEYSGSAMGVGSFFAYASVLWAYVLNGKIIDKFPDDPVKAYEQIFLIGAVVAGSGAIFAFLAIRRTAREIVKEA